MKLKQRVRERNTKREGPKIEIERERERERERGRGYKAASDGERSSPALESKLPLDVDATLPGPCLTVVVNALSRSGNHANVENHRQQDRRLYRRMSSPASALRVRLLPRRHLHLPVRLFFSFFIPFIFIIFIMKKISGFDLRSAGFVT